MGMNTSVIVLNDALDSIENDPEFGKKIGNAIRECRHHNRYRADHGVDISCGSHCNAATVVETHHADETTLLAFGGNCVSNLGGVYGYRHNAEEIQVALLKMLAEKLGYRVVKVKVKE